MEFPQVPNKALCWGPSYEYQHNDFMEKKAILSVIYPKNTCTHLNQATRLLL